MKPNQRALTEIAVYVAAALFVLALFGVLP